MRLNGHDLDQRALKELEDRLSFWDKLKIRALFMFYWGLVMASVIGSLRLYSYLTGG
jgi:hypothetical protein